MNLAEDSSDFQVLAIGTSILSIIELDIMNPELFLMLSEKMLSKPLQDTQHKNSFIIDRRFHRETTF